MLLFLFYLEFLKSKGMFLQQVHTVMEEEKKKRERKEKATKDLDTIMEAQTLDIK